MRRESEGLVQQIRVFCFAASCHDDLSLKSGVGEIPRESTALNKNHHLFLKINEIKFASGFIHFISPFTKPFIKDLFLLATTGSVISAK